jgi:asparagine synthase (glutamine-hydrolysing)
LSSIVGVYSKSGENVLQYLIRMIQETLHRGSNFVGIDLNHNICREKRIEKLLDCGIEGYCGIGAASRDTEQPLQHEESDLSLICDGEIYNRSRIEELTNKQFSVDKESILFLFEKFLPAKSDMSLAMEQTLNFLDGVYSFALFYKNLFIIARDPIGVKPLYISERDGTIAFASERKALWSIGMLDAYPLPPSSWATIGESGIKINHIENLREKYDEKLSLETAEQKLLELLTRSLEKRIKNERVGVLFSGGLDSAMLTKIIQDLGYEPSLYCSGVEGSKDIGNAIQAAEKLGLPLKINFMTLEKLQENLPNIVYMSEETNPMKLSIALPLFFSSQQAKSDGLEFMISGNGADELLGGYAKYVQILESSGYTALHQALFKDVKEMAEGNVQRDDATGMANSIELKLPYLDYEFVKYALSVPPQYKIVKINSTYIRKFISRKIAEKIELPETLVNRPKIAMQFGSLSQNLLEKLAKRSGFNKNLARKYGYQSPLKLYIETIARLKKVPGTKPELETLIPKIK